jgi:hypothetical protein
MIRPEEAQKPTEGSFAALNLRGLDPKLKRAFRELSLRTGTSMTEAVKAYMRRCVSKCKLLGTKGAVT